MNRRTFNRLSGAGLAVSEFVGLLDKLGLTAPPRPSSPAPARVSYDAQKQSWTLNNLFMEREMFLDPKRGLVARRLLDRRIGKNWLTDRSERGSDVYVMIGDKFCFGPSPEAGFEYAGQSSERQPDGSTALRIRFALRPENVELTLFYRCFDDSPYVEQWCRLENKSEKPSLPVGRFDPFFMALEAGPGERRFNLHWLNGIQDFGYQRGVQEDIQPYPPYRLRNEPLRAESQIQLNSSAPGDRYGRRELGSTQYFNWFAVEDAEQSAGLMGGLQWEGAWVLNFNRWSAHEIEVYGGVNKCTRVLGPGEVLESPRAFYGHYHGGLDTGLRELHAFLRRYIMPPNPDEQFPWVHYNSWIPFGTKISEKVLKPELDIAQEIGVECFYLDAGWCEYTDEKMEGGLGNWVGDPMKFPSGIAGFSEDVHRRGMRFAIWVEPERTNLRFVGNEIQEVWLSKPWGYYVGLDGTVVICFGNPEARTWAKEWLERMISAFKVDWIRWDLNSYNICNRPDHGHQAGDGDFQHVKGVYEVMGYLKQRFPKLVIENCSAGNNRFGFGVMRYANTTLNSDVLWPSYRARYQMIGGGYPFPAQYQLATYLSAPTGSADTPKEPADGDSSPTYLDYLFRSRMMGTFGMSDRMVAWTPNIKEAARKAIRDFKKLRPILGGDTYHPLAQPLILTPPLHPPHQWEAVQYYHPELDSSVIFSFRAQATEQTKVLPVEGLVADHRYRVTHEDAGKKYTATGQTLAREGISVHLPRMNSSELIWFEKA